MGLDMYLSAKLRKATVGASEFPTQSYESVDVSIPVAYWRKANAIHKWFVNNCQNGKDECQEAHVSIEQLAELRDLCKRVNEKHSAAYAQEHLPTQSGFFFGGVAYDDDYYADLDHTISQIDQIDAVLKAVSKAVPKEKWEFCYQSSW